MKDGLVRGSIHTVSCIRRAPLALDAKRRPWIQPEGTPAGEIVHDGPRVALCRCGNTKNAAFCDNTHQEVGLRDPPLRPAAGAGAPA